MNKITSTLAGLAIVASASIAPAMAQGNLFSPPGTFTFTGLGTSNFSATGTGETFNPLMGTPVTPVGFSLTGTGANGSTSIFNLGTLTITGANVGGAGINSFTETGPLTFVVAGLGAGGVGIASLGAAADGTTFNLVGGAPVPEASTTVSFGALLALGGLAVVLRRKGVKNAA
jgi:hypothetical protein